jgi:hypothetical protein
MKENNRYIKKLDREEVDNSSGLKCAWCGTNLKERHHIELFSEGGSNKSANLILLCPNCHTLAHQNVISRLELLKRRKELSGYVDRSSGCLTIDKKIAVKIGSNLFIETPNIIEHKGENLITVTGSDTEMLVSLKLYDKCNNLICWMHENKWWVENEEIFDFHLSKSTFSVISKDEEINLEIKIGKEYITINGCIFMNGKKNCIILTTLMPSRHYSLSKFPRKT